MSVLSNVQFSGPHEDPEDSHATRVTASHPAWGQVGQLSWYHDQLAHDEKHSIAYVKTEPEHRRQGIATALYDHAKALEPALHHARTLSEDGERWARGMDWKRGSR